MHSPRVTILGNQHIWGFFYQNYLLYLLYPQKMENFPTGPLRVKYSGSLVSQKEAWFPTFFVGRDYSALIKIETPSKGPRTYIVSMCVCVCVCARALYSQFVIFLSLSIYCISMYIYPTQASTQTPPGRSRGLSVLHCFDIRLHPSTQTS
jgi:hypothetical protein